MAVSCFEGADVRVAAAQAGHTARARQVAPDMAVDMAGWGTAA